MSHNAVMVDTDVFSNTVLRAASTASAFSEDSLRLRSALEGVRVVISFQTRMELLQGAVNASWGTARISQLRQLLGRVTTIGVDDAVIDACANLYAQCRKGGHPLHDKVHSADRWVAACAIAKGLPLLSNDQIFKSVPGLTLWR